MGNFHYWPHGFLGLFKDCLALEAIDYRLDGIGPISLWLMKLKFLEVFSRLIQIKDFGVGLGSFSQGSLDKLFRPRWVIVLRGLAILSDKLMMLIITEEQQQPVGISLTKMELL